MRQQHFVFFFFFSFILSKIHQERRKEACTKQTNQYTESHIRMRSLIGIDCENKKTQDLNSDSTESMSTFHFHSSTLAVAVTLTENQCTANELNFSNDAPMELMRWCCYDGCRCWWLCVRWYASISIFSFHLQFDLLTIKNCWACEKCERRTKYTKINTNKSISVQRWWKINILVFREKEWNAVSAWMQSIENLNKNNIQITVDRLFFFAVKYTTNFNGKNEFRKQTDSDRETDGIEKSSVLGRSAEHECGKKKKNEKTNMELLNISPHENRNRQRKNIQE